MNCKLDEEEGSHSGVREEQLTLRNPVRRNGMSFTSPSARLLSFHPSIKVSTPFTFPFTPANPKSSHNHPDAKPSRVSVQARDPPGSNASINRSFRLWIRIRKSCSEIHGSNISGYMLLKHGARSPRTIQSRRMRMMRVEAVRGEESGT